MICRTGYTGELRILNWTVSDGKKQVQGWACEEVQKYKHKVGHANVVLFSVPKCAVRPGVTEEAAQKKRCACVPRFVSSF